ncbi:hypothetical protein CCH79_00001451 [Gambusia affinis]|uniref:G protein gamma domain-containing protein n=1 Tax=Gambusia affinis TaxID=33528 RepID=A0A315VRS6_GAMAF|nr:hypothetical protein CCH79_00001451 [Gambusia affinis]
MKHICGLVPPPLPAPAAKLGQISAEGGHTMKDSIVNNSTANISQARKAVEQLKMEACMDRIKCDLKVTRMRSRGPNNVTHVESGQCSVVEEVNMDANDPRAPAVPPLQLLLCSPFASPPVTPTPLPSGSLRSHTVSKAAADLMAYCDAHTREDPLIVPVPASENPFREKKFFCNIL